MRFIHDRKKMGLLDNRKYATTARLYYLHIIYLVMIGLSAGILGNFNAEYGDETNHEHRYLNCALVGATDKDTCPKLNDDTTDQNNQIFNLSVAVVVLNSLYLVWSIVSHWGFLINVHFMLQWVFSAVNVGIFAGVVGWFNASDGLFEEANLENSEFFKDQASPYALAVIALVLGILDLVIFNVLNLTVFKGRCVYVKHSASSQ